MDLVPILALLVCLSYAFEFSSWSIFYVQPFFIQAYIHGFMDTHTQKTYASTFLFPVYLELVEYPRYRDKKNICRIGVVYFRATDVDLFVFF